MGLSSTAYAMTLELGLVESRPAAPRSVCRLVVPKRSVTTRTTSGYSFAKKGPGRSRDTSASSRVLAPLAAPRRRTPVFGVARRRDARRFGTTRRGGGGARARSGIVVPAHSDTRRRRGAERSWWSHPTPTTPRCSRRRRARACMPAAALVLVPSRFSGMRSPCRRTRRGPRRRASACTGRRGMRFV